MSEVAAEVLSDVLRAVRLTGAVFFEIDATSPWAAETPHTETIAPMVMPQAQHVIEYHVLLSGHCWASRLSCNQCEETVELGPGSIVIFPHGDPHVLSSDPELRAPPDLALYRQPAGAESLPFSLTQGGGGPKTASVVCGFLGCDAVPFNPLLQALPPLVHVSGGASEDGSWLGSLIRAALAESRAERLASGAVLARLSELIFVEAVRRYAESLPSGASGWLAALADPHVSQAIRLIHAEPQRPWTLASLAKDVGVSRSVLAERFSFLLGTPPIAYLQQWRMQLARGLLQNGARTIGDVAEAVGYESEAAFSRAYKRFTGISPAVVARRTVGSSKAPSQQVA